MKIDRLETHDRLLHFQKQGDLISKGCRDCIKNRPKEFGNRPFYIFAHPRTIGLDERIAIFNDDFMSSTIDVFYQRKYDTLESVPTARYLWAPRLTKPNAQENSMLFKAYPAQEDMIKVIWIIPCRELWGLYERRKMTENQGVVESIHAFMNDRGRLEAREEDDLPDAMVDAIYTEISRGAGSKDIKLV